MSLSAEVIDALVAAGCTVEQLAAAVKADLAAEEQRALVKRAKDAARQRKSRANRSESRDVTVTPCDERDPLDKKDPQTPKKINPQAPPISPPNRKGAPAKPADVAEQVWDDWLALRSKKRAPVSVSVIDGARAEAGKLGWTLEQVLREWVFRGSQGFKAEWINQGTGPPGKPAEPVSFLSHLIETDRRRQQAPAEEFQHGP